VSDDTPRTTQLESQVRLGQIDQYGLLHAFEMLEREFSTLKVHLADANKGARINAMVNQELAKKNKALSEDKARLDWLQALDPDSTVWFKVSDSICIRAAIDAVMQEKSQ